MPEPGLQEMEGSGAGMRRVRPFVAKASGDSMACTMCPHQEIFRSSSKHKTYRKDLYALENALVGLCDVWFDEIKPYLVRNHIKVHVKCGSASGDHEHQAAAPASPRFDPGAAPDRPAQSARCALSAPPAARRPRDDTTTNRTTSRRPAPPLLAETQTPRENPQNEPHNDEQKQVGQPCIRRRRRRRAIPEPSWRVPRLCRTSTVLCRPGAGSQGVKTTPQPLPLPPPPRDDFYRFIVPRRESVMKNKSTQTEQVPSVSRGCQSLRPRYPSPTPRYRSPEARRERAPASYGSASPPPVRPLRVICRFKRPEATVGEMPPLLQDDLLDIIAEGNEKRLKLLYSSSEKDDHDHHTFMNLIRSSQQEKSGHKKLPPWR